MNYRINKESILKRLNLRTRIDSVTNCWIWIGATDYKHGHINMQGKTVKIHRLSAHLFLDFDLESSFQINHKRECPNMTCWNPKHLYVGTQADNVADQIALGTHINVITEANKVKEFCKNGHSLSGDNLYTSKWGRQCKICRKITRTKHYQNKHV